VWIERAGTEPPVSGLSRYGRIMANGGDVIGICITVREEIPQRLAYLNEFFPRGRFEVSYSIG
jgi:hypothetical protein